MAYNNGREDRKWRIWKEAEEKVLREHGVDETTIEQIRIDDRADFNSNRRFYHWTSDFGEYLEGMADKEQSSEIKTVTDLLDEIEDENLYQAYMIVGTERRHGFSQNDVDRQWHQIVDKIRKKQVDGVIVANMSVITDNLIDAFIKVAQVQAAGGIIVTVDDGRLAMQLRGF